VAGRGDILQLELDEGPCLESMRGHKTIISQDLRREERWPRWTSQAAELGIEGVMSLWLYTNTCSFGALNMYADQTNAFDSKDCTNAQAFATQISIALAARREIYQRSIAMEHRTVIGQAEGILMERLGIDADHAFAYLRRLSQCENRKLITICNEIVATRQLPQ
jgi:ANTAR domain/GAF domain